MNKVLSAQHITKSYGKKQVLHDVSIDIEPGVIYGLIGRNGAGKTTLLTTIMNQVKSSEGTVSFLGESLHGKHPAAIVQSGMTMVPEGRRVFARTSVIDNIRLGGYFRKDRAEMKKDMEKMFEMFPRLYERKGQMAGTLSGGEQQMLAIARALMSRPKLLLLDEPSMGLAPLLVEQIFSIIEELNAAGTTILLVEQNARMALSIAHRGYVLETGNIVTTGTGKELLTNDSVRKAYLGG